MKKTMRILLIFALLFTSLDISVFSAEMPRRLAAKNINREDLGVSFDIGSNPHPTLDPTSLLFDFAGSFTKYTFDDGLPAYDVEFEAQGLAGSHDNILKMNYNDNYLVNGTRKADIALALAYGYNGTVRYGADTPAQHNEEYIATQIVIWLVLGVAYDRPAQDAIIELFTQNTPSTRLIVNKIIKQMKDHLNLPSFVNANQSNAPIYDITFNPETMKYEIEFTEQNYITDMNGQQQPVLKYFKPDTTTIKYMEEKTDTTIKFAAEVKDALSEIKFIRETSEFLTETDDNSKLKLKQYTIDFWRDNANPNNNDKVSIRPDDNYPEDIDIVKPGFLRLNRLIGILKIVKTDALTNERLQGAKFTIHHAKDGSLLFPSEYESNKNGEINIRNIPVSPANTFFVKEVAAPDGYITDNTTTYTVGEILPPVPIDPDNPGNGSQQYVLTLDITNEQQKGSIRIKKVDGFTDRELAGAKIGLYDAADTTFANPLQEMITPADGSITFSNLNHGAYVVKEIAAPQGYILTDQTISVTVGPGNIDVDLTQDVNQYIRNNQQLGSVTVRKVDDHTNQSLAGAKLGIYDITDTAFANPIQEVISNADGIVTFTNLHHGQYVIKEIEAPIGYILSNQELHVEVKPDQLDVHLENDDTQYVRNKQQLGSITARKVDDYNNQNLAGAKIGIYDAADTAFANPLQEVISDANGIFTFVDLPHGSYAIKEIEAPQGYILTDQVLHADIRPDQLHVQLENDPTQYLRNNQQLGSVTLRKVDDFNNTFLAGAKIGIYDAADTTFTTPLQEVVSDDQGLVVFSNLHHGRYVVKEIEAPMGYLLTNQTITVDILPNQLHVDLANDETQFIRNTQVKGSVTAKKIDGYTNQSLAGARFGIYDVTDTGFTTPLQEQISDANGIFKFVDLHHGTYVIKEIASPSGYLVTDQTITIEIKPDQLDIHLENDENQFVANNQELGSVTVRKVDDFTSQDLAGATLGIYDATDTAFANPIQEVVSNTDGIVTFTNLHHGQYVIKEIAAPTGYILTDQTIRIEIKPGQLHNDLSQDPNSYIRNEQQLGSVVLRKIDGDTGKPLANAVVKIYEKNDVDFTNPLQETVSDADGLFRFTNLHHGMYIVKEFASPLGYVLTDQIIEIEVKSDNIDVNLADDEKKFLKNVQDRGTITARKVDGASMQGLSGARIGLYSGMDESYEEPIQETVSGIDGIFTFRNLMHGEYKIREIEAPKGYILTDQIIEVEIRPDQLNVNIEDIVDKQLQNEKEKGSITARKVDDRDDANLAGAKIGLYMKDDVQFTNPIQESISDEDGIFSFQGLDYGKYVIREIEAPLGYELTDQIISVEINVDNLNIQLENDASQYLRNKQSKGSVTARKVNSTTFENVQGAKIGIYEKEDIEFKTPIQEAISDEQGLFTFKELYHGEYVIREMEAPKGYELTDQQISVTISAQQLHVSLENVEEQYLKNSPILFEEVTSPVTGDASGRNTLFIMMVCSGFGIFYLMRRREL